MSAALVRDPLLPRPADATGRGAAMALLAHGLLVIALAAGVSWHQRPAETFSAEIWAALPERAAPRPVEPTPQPAPRPQYTPAPPAPPPPAPTRTDADIALEKAKARAEQEERERQERLERQRQIEREREAEVRRQREAEAALLKQQRELQKKRQEELARKAEEARQTAALEAQRQENLKRMLGQAGATGGPSATGTAQRDAAPSAAYAGRLVAAIKPNIVLTDSLPASLEAVVEVRAAPGGTILSRSIVKSSGNAVWDEAVLRAVDRTAKLPADRDGRVPPRIEISFRPE